MDSLAAVVQQQLRLDPFSGAVFVFRAKRADRVKLLVWDGSGLTLIYKRLDEARFSVAQRKECSRRVSFPPPVSPFGTFFSLPLSAAGTPQNAGLSAHLSEPRGRARKPILGRLWPLSGPFL
jgi:hypothetical protein